MVTIKDISKRCGVSTATVSKALNGYGDISEKTAAKIRKVAEEMNYLPNAAARQLKTNSSHNIGVLFVDETMSGLTHEYFSSILNSAKEEFERLGYDITFINKKVGGKASSFLQHTRYRKMDGVLIASVDFENPDVRELVDSEIPTVTIDYSYDGHSSVMSDNIDGNYELTKYILEKGHRRIGVLRGEMTDVTKKRMNGFYRACREFNVTIPDEYIIETAYHSTSINQEATRKLMNLPKPPTVIMYPDDFAYLGGMRELEQLGLNVPEDISVTGYDGIHLSQVLQPKLTTYKQDAEAIGRKSARKLVETIEDKQNCVSEMILVQGKLLEGKSVKDIN